MRYYDLTANELGLSLKAHYAKVALATSTVLWRVRNRSRTSYVGCT